MAGDDTKQAEIIDFPAMGQIVANFLATFKDMKVDRGGNLLITFFVPKQEKYEAISVTDYPGMLVRMQVKREVVNYAPELMEEAAALGLVEDFDSLGGDDGRGGG